MPKNPAPRTQAMRRKETSAAIIQATIDLIERLGYGNLRTKHITQEAGITWGAVQHLFGGKEELLLSVVRHALDKISTQIDRIRLHDASIEQRSDRIVDLTWNVYNSRDYFALIEIVRGTKGDKQIHRKIVDANQRVRSHIQQVWLEAFSDAPISEDQVILACEHLTLTLSGLASRRRYLWPRGDITMNLEFAKAVCKSIVCDKLLDVHTGSSTKIASVV